MNRIKTITVGAILLFMCLASAGQPGRDAQSKWERELETAMASDSTADVEMECPGYYYGSARIKVIQTK